MGLHTDREQLIAAWRAFKDWPKKQGWQTINIGLCSTRRILAGRHFPGNEEALLVGFTSAKLPNSNQLPQGSGFQVSKAENVDTAPGFWIALHRQDAGSIELFSLMAVDVIETLAALPPNDDEQVLRVFLSRIKAWQEFMRRGIDRTLGPESEVGLFGELLFLIQLNEAGVPIETSLQAWRGPLDGIQDFVFGTGAIEVKTTAMSGGFPATIGSLEQLDDSLISPMFLAAIRIVLDSKGWTLPQIVHHVRTLMADEASTLAEFNSNLIHAGYLEVDAERYTRAFKPIDTKIFRVSDSFPRLTRGNIAIPIRSARYEIDLDLVSAADMSLIEAIKQLGVI